MSDYTERIKKLADRWREASDNKKMNVRLLTETANYFEQLSITEARRTVQMADIHEFLNRLSTDQETLLKALSKAPPGAVSGVPVSGAVHLTSGMPAASSSFRRAALPPAPEGYVRIAVGYWDNDKEILVPIDG